ncbi:DUF3794 and LysM peptidoglycan-binding domain-containing protein [Clostridium massiliamazoniense]|uniref:DUF3794 and LysM peptidoglycan-binding domain-containing protein n=1 Tax=Clostridium massiliamazoniense TaxID=1347366 RepID=UPI0006D798B4|nr:SPOCS domain-containing protein [Clostridium massiliamazoniense]
MVNIDIVKENIDLQKEFGENTVDNVLRDEYLIPDTHPDVEKILAVDVRKTIVNKEMQADRVYVEAEVEYSIMYLSNEEEKEVNNIVYKEKFSNFVDMVGAEHRMLCDANCELEHINSNIINERKISIEAYFRTTCKVYSQESFEFVKDVQGSDELEIRKKPDKFEKMICSKSGEMTGKASMKAPSDKPQVDKILKYDCMIHKGDVKILEDKIQYSCLAKINVIYRCEETKELVTLEDDIFISGEDEVVGVNSDMKANYKNFLKSFDVRLNQDDLGENRIIDVDVCVENSVLVTKMEEMEVIDDAYSPRKNIEITKEKLKVNTPLGEGHSEFIVKDNIYLDNDDAEPVYIMNIRGEVISLESKIVNGNVIIDGILKADVIYKSNNERLCLGKVEGEIAFNSMIEIPRADETMICDIKANLENIQGNIEANTIAVKAVLDLNAKVSFTEEKEYVKDISENEEEKIDKKASIIIYIVQPGDTMWNLAKKYRTSIADICKVNSLEVSDEIKEGEKLIIPGRAII